MTRNFSEEELAALKSAKQVAEALGVSASHIHWLRAQGHLPGAIWIGEQWHYPPEAIAHARTRRSRGRPKKTGLPGYQNACTVSS